MAEGEAQEAYMIPPHDSDSPRSHFRQFAVGTHFAYNFCRAHQTLTRAAKGIYRTPAMVARLTDHVWTVADIVALLDTKADQKTAS